MGGDICYYFIDKYMCEHIRRRIKMFCKNCGKEIDDNAYVCVHCGVKVKEDNSAAVNADADNGSKVGWGFLSWFVPLAGLILFCVWRKERPKTAKVCGLCALIAFIVEIVVSILYVVLVVMIAVNSGTMSIAPFLI